MVVKICSLEGYELLYQVTSGTRSVVLRARTDDKLKNWVSAVNDAALRPQEGWCHPHRFGSFAPPRGITEDGSQAQWFVDGCAAFEAIALAIEEAKSEVSFTDIQLIALGIFIDVFCGCRLSHL